MYTDDDGTTESDAIGSILRCGGASIFSVEQSSSPVSILDELLPPALLRNRDALLTALRACANNLEIELCDYNSSGPVVPGDQSPRPARSQQTLVREKHICDVTSTFKFLPSLMAETGTFPSYITVHPNSETRRETSVTNAVALVQWKNVLTKVKSLELCGEPMLIPRRKLNCRRPKLEPSK